MSGSVVISCCVIQEMIPLSVEKANAYVQTLLISHSKPAVLFKNPDVALKYCDCKFQNTFVNLLGL